MIGIFFFFLLFFFGGGGSVANSKSFLQLMIKHTKEYSSTDSIRSKKCIMTEYVVGTFAFRILNASGQC